MKRAIAGQRGSVRGVPPDVLAPFTSFADDDDADWTDSLEFFKGIGGLMILALIGVLLAVVWTCVWPASLFSD